MRLRLSEFELAATRRFRRLLNTRGPIPMHSLPARPHGYLAPSGAFLDCDECGHTGFASIHGCPPPAGSIKLQHRGAAHAILYARDAVHYTELQARTLLALAHSQPLSVSFWRV